MTTIDATTATQPPPLRDELCRIAIAHFGRFGFDESAYGLMTDDATFRSFVDGVSAS